MRPSQPAFLIALSIVSILSHPCSRAISGRYVAVYDLFSHDRLEDVSHGVDKGDGVLESESDDVAGCENVMLIPCTPIVQSRYEVASSKSVSSEILQWITLSTTIRGKRETADVRALEIGKLPLLDLIEPRVSECADEGILR